MITNTSTVGEKCGSPQKRDQYDAVLFELDGVITQTVHE